MRVSTFIRWRSIPVILAIVLAGCTYQPQSVTVSHVVDGDTIKVTFSNGTEETVRIIGIDTPETVDPRKKVQCYGPEASKHMHELVEGKTVILETKPDEDKDKYGRLLRYIKLNDQDIGAELITEGYARNYPFFPHPRVDSYTQLELKARAEKRGLWGKCI